VPDGQLLKECKGVFPHEGGTRRRARDGTGGGGVCWMTGDLRSPIRFGYFFVIL
jgi:hypothetical protein